MFTASQLVAFVLSMVGMPYWYGTCVYPCTQALLTSKSKQYPSHYGASRMAKYKAAIAARQVCMDCVGMIKGFFWTNGGQGVRAYIDGGPAFANKYGANGCPDKSADGMLTWLKKQGCKHGKISDLTDVPGILLFSKGHVGVYIGGGWAVEARGFNYGVVKTRVKDRGWTEWAYMPASLLLYDGAQEAPDAPKPEPPAEPKPDTQRILKRGMTGEDVKAMQAGLMYLGYKLPRYGADGDFGAETEAALKAFQRGNGLDADGEFGQLTRAAMVKALEALNAPRHVKIEGGDCYVRSAPYTSARALGVAHRGDVLPFQGETSPEGWLLVEYKGQNGWVSGKYGRVTT